MQSFTIREVTVRLIIFLLVSYSCVVHAQWQRFDVLNAKGNPIAATSIAIDDSSIWIGTKDDGIQCWQGGRMQLHLTKERGLASNAVRAIAVDRYHRVWVATDNGLCRYESGKFKTWVKNDITLLTNDITDVHIDSDDLIWVGTGRGLVRINGDRWSVFDEKSTNKSLPSEKIRAVASDWRGVIWVATSAGLASFDGKQWKAFSEKSHGLPANDLFDVAVAEDGSVWMASDNGVARFDGMRSENFLKSLPTNRVAVDLAGRCWVATLDEGIVKIADGREKTYGLGSGLTSAETFDVACDRFGDLWVGHKAGLQKFIDSDEAEARAEQLFRWADAFLVQGQWKEARRFFETIVAREFLTATSVWPTVQLRMAELNWSEGNVVAALDWTRKFLTAFPSRPESKELLLAFADSLAEHGKWTEAHKAYQQHIDTYPDDPLNEAILFRQAVLLEKDGDTFGASRLLQKINNKYPSNERFDEFRYHIAELEERQKGRSAVQMVYNDLVASTKDPEVLYRLSDLHDDANRTTILDRISGTVEWKTYPTPSGVNTINPVDAKTFWLGLESHGVMRWDVASHSGTSLLLGLSGVNVSQVYRDADGDLWAVIGDLPKKSLCNLNYSKNKTRWTIMGPPFMDKKIHQVYYRRRDQVIVAGTNKGLMIGGRVIGTKQGLPSNEVKFVQEDAGGIVWAISGNALVQLASEPKVMIRPMDMNFQEVRDFTIDERQTKWLATDAGLYAYDGTWKRWNTKNGLSSDDLRCVAVTADGQIAVGSAAGVDYFNGKFWLHFDQTNGLTAGKIRDVAFGPDGGLWIASDVGLHQRKSSGDAEKALMVKAALEQEATAWKEKNYRGLNEAFSPLSTFADLQEWVDFKRALNLERQGQLTEAFALYSKIRLENPVTIWIPDLYLYRLARKMESAGLSDQAASIFKELGRRWNIEQRPTYRIQESLMRLADRYASTGKPDNARAIREWLITEFDGGAFKSQIADRWFNEISASMKANGKPSEERLNFFLRKFAADSRRDMVRFWLCGRMVALSRHSDAADELSALTSSERAGFKLLAGRELVRLKRLVK